MNEGGPASRRRMDARQDKGRGNDRALRDQAAADSLAKRGLARTKITSGKYHITSFHQLCQPFSQQPHRLASGDFDRQRQLLGQDHARLTWAVNDEATMLPKGNEFRKFGTS